MLKLTRLFGSISSIQFINVEPSKHHRMFELPQNAAKLQWYSFTSRCCPTQRCKMVALSGSKYILNWTDSNFNWVELELNECPALSYWRPFPCLTEIHFWKFSKLGFEPLWSLNNIILTYYLEYYNLSEEISFI